MKISVFKISHIFFCITCLIAFADLLPLPANALTHTFHTSLTRVDYNEKNKTAEISLQVFAHDLEAALERFHGKPVNLEKTPEIEKIILKYLSERFVLKNKNGAIKDLNFVGKEQSADTVWLYLETAMPENLENAVFENRLFFELHNDQVNLATFRSGKNKQDLIFKPGDQSKTVFGRTND